MPRQADVAATNDHGETALDLATGAECTPIVELLSGALSLKH